MQNFFLMPVPSSARHNRETRTLQYENVGWELSDNERAAARASFAKMFSNGFSARASELLKGVDKCLQSVSSWSLHYRLLKYMKGRLQTMVDMRAAEPTQVVGWEFTAYELLLKVVCAGDEGNGRATSQEYRHDGRAYRRDCGHVSGQDL
jgi:hypothetical protein